MLKKLVNLFCFYFFNKRNKHQPKSQPYFDKRQTTKNKQLLILFLCSFYLTQSLAAEKIPAIAQAPAVITIAQNNSPESLLEQARRLYQQGQFQTAIELLQQAADTFAARENSSGQAQSLNFQGQVYLAQGQPKAAAESFAAAATIYEEIGDNQGVVKIQINQAQALRRAGLYRRALATIEQANDSLTEEPDSLLKAIALRSLGITQRLVGDLNDAEETIEQSLAIAQAENSPEDISAAYLMLGNISKDRANKAQERSETREIQGNFQQADEYYQQAADNATTSNAKIEAQLNQLSLLGDREEEFTEEQWELLAQIRDTIEQLPLSSTAISARINWARMVMEQENRINVSPQDIAQQLTLALQQARELQEPRAEAYALGQLGELRLEYEQLEQAEENTRQALIVAQSIGASDVVYRFQWQLAQILKEQGKSAGAVAAYENAVNNLDILRNDLVSVNRDVQFSFRDSVEPVYREFVSLLLSEEDSSQQDIAKARKIIESLQEAELVNFFQENCLTASPVEIDQIDSKAGVISPIVLKDRIEVIVTLPIPEAESAESGVRLLHKSVPLPPDEEQTYFIDTFAKLREAVAPRVSVDPNRGLNEESELDKSDFHKLSLTTKDENLSFPASPRPRVPASLFRLATDSEPKESEERATIGVEGATPGKPEDYLPLAQKVYDWLIRPIEQDIANSGVETLVFILDAPLLNLPMAALHDGKQYLIEKYAIAFTPSLQLLESQPLERGELTALKAGISKTPPPVELASTKEPLQFSQLPNVQAELDKIQSQVPGELIVNEEFTNKAIQKAIGSAPFPVVHLATHGLFSSTPEDTFILTWEDTLNIDQLNQLLRGREEGQEKPIELLVLSACQTATGDRRAALGLAGVAVKAGARSTLATLWVVNDAATAELMIDFYQELNQDKTISKAQALRRAQISMIKGDNTERQKPYYWAPFVLVGNWL
ncbi:MAG: CHAT domain-containing protein [Symploca sp. SIO1C2]|nr:CHAT domain-containing protein [Symploca sp. SIO1C2]